MRLADRSRQPHSGIDHYRQMNYWIRAYDHKRYRVADFIRDNGYVDWNQRNHFLPGDIVFLYATAPLSRLTFAMEVSAVDLTWQSSADDGEYFISQEYYDKWVQRRQQTLYTRYSLIRELHSPLLSLSSLKEHGLSGAPRSPRRLYPETVDFILSHLE